MREVFQHRGMRLLFVANLISMIGSGMNAAAVIWYILQATHAKSRSVCWSRCKPCPRSCCCRSPGYSSTAKTAAT